MNERKNKKNRKGLEKMDTCLFVVVAAVFQNKSPHTDVFGTRGRKNGREGLRGWGGWGGGEDAEGGGGGAQCVWGVWGGEEPPRNSSTWRKCHVCFNCPTLFLATLRRPLSSAGLASPGL